MRKSISHQNGTVKGQIFNGMNGIFIPYRLIRFVRQEIGGGIEYAAILSQLYYWEKMPEYMWSYRTVESLADQLEIPFPTLFRMTMKLRKRGYITTERKGKYILLKLNIEKVKDFFVDDNYQIDNQNDNQVDYQNDYQNDNQNDNRHTAQTVESQSIPDALDSIRFYKILQDSNEILQDSKSKSSIISADLVSQDTNFQALEKSTKLEGVIAELKNASAPNYAIPKEFEGILLTEMMKAGFPRKSLRSRLDRENLHILKEHYGDWETVIKAFQNLRKLQSEGRFLGWNWAKILRNADYLADYEPEPEFPVDRIDDLEGLRRYFANVRPPKKYVARFIYRWVNHWKFVDMPPERTKRLIEEILKYYYPDPKPQNDPLLEDVVEERVEED